MQESKCEIIQTEKREYKREWREKNKGHIREYHRAWRQKNKERLDKYNDDFWLRKAREREEKRYNK